ncbi:MAG TPA: hypothetical protein VFI24_04075 [Pyrinomonadaceae bacterium]|nr:hypothetical protein [Pyrinomonadaceae bacterium]
MKQAISAIFIAVLGTLTLAQAQQTPSVGKCPLTLTHAPKIRDVRLGMSSEDVLKMFPGSSDEPDIRAQLSTADQRFGVAGFSIPTTLLPRPKFAGVNSLFVVFLDNRLSEYTFTYTGVEWKNVDDFISRFSETFNLPRPETWQRSNLPSLKTLYCEGFEMWASVDAGGSWIKIRIPKTQQIVSDRQEAQKEKARKEFKP